jgi:hypothetical protein
MVITSLDDLQVYRLAVRAADAVSAILTSHYSSIGKMLTQWLKHLVKEDRKSRT